MLLTKLKYFLDTFYRDEDKTRTVMINGAWGSGKTFTVHSFVENNNVNSIYLSLFGLKNPQDIFARLAEHLDSSYLDLVNGKYSIKPSFKELEYNNTLVVLDDLERKHDELKFVGIFGIIDSLRKLGFKIVAIIYDKNIKDVDYYDFREKTFDTVINTEADFGIYNEVLGDGFQNYPSIDEEVFKSIDTNWRIFKRAAFKYKLFDEELKKRNLTNFCSDIGITDSSLFQYIMLADKCFFSTNSDAPAFKKDDFSKITYDRRKEMFGTYTANDLYKLSKEETTISMQRIEELIDLFSNGDFDSYFEHFYYKKDNSFLDENPILYKMPFFLEDDEKDKYKTVFLKNIDLFNFSLQTHQNILKSFLSNFIKHISKKEKKRIMERIVNTIPSDESRRFLDLFMLEDNNDALLSFVDELSNMFEEKSIKEVLGELGKLGINNKYKEMTHFLYDNRHVSGPKKKAIFNYLKNNHFLLPDLSKTVDYSSWGYCHEVAKYVCGSEAEKGFVEELKQQCLSNERSVSVRERCSALVLYNLNKTIDFAKEYPIKARPKKALKKKQ